MFCTEYSFDCNSVVVECVTQTVGSLSLHDKTAFVHQLVRKNIRRDI